MDEDTEIITIIIGEEGSESQAKEIEAGLLAINDELEIEIHQGDQPVYPYLILSRIKYKWVESVGKTLHSFFYIRWCEMNLQDPVTALSGAWGKNALRP